MDVRLPRGAWGRWARSLGPGLGRFLRTPLGLGIAGLVFIALGWLVYQAATWPEVARLMGENPQTTAFIERYRARRRAAGESDRVAWHWVRSSAMSSNLKRAVIVAEDIEFFSHRGFSGSEVRAALRKAIAERARPRGASTITQQLAKNLWLSPSRSPVRKVKEALLTRQLERHVSKERILELYLNVVEFGRGVYGAEAAARHYFGKSASALSAHEAAQLAASLPRPSTWHPGSGSRGYPEYVAAIERRMGRASFLDRRLGGRAVVPPIDSSAVIPPGDAPRPSTLEDTMAQELQPSASD